MLHHATLEVRPDDVEAAVAFWALLGFHRVVPPPLLRDRFTWVERAGTQIHLMPVPEPAVPPEGHVAVLADDYAGALSALRGAGYEPRPGSNAWGAERVFVRGPGGHRVEVMSGLPSPPWPGEA